MPKDSPTDPIDEQTADTQGDELHDEIAAMTNTVDTDGLRKKLAAIEHERWADWQKWCHEVLRKSGELTEGADDILQRWDRQIETPYSELSDQEKASDMEQVDRYWPLIQKYIADHDAALLAKLEAALPERQPVLDLKLDEPSKTVEYIRRTAKNSAVDACRQAIRSVIGGEK